MCVCACVCVYVCARLFVVAEQPPWVTSHLTFNIGPLVLLHFIFFDSFLNQQTSQHYASPSRQSEYDIAVIETQARRPISVKVKQFSLQGARIQNDWQGPQMVKYKNKLHPWKYIVVLPVSRNPIKIASPNLSQLKPVHEGIRRVLNAQQSRSGGGGHSVQPIPRDAYRSSERRREDEHDGRGSGGGGYSGREGGF